MKNVFKNKIVTVVILIATLVLAGIAVFTAIRLYQLREEAVAPNVPTSEPAAQVPADNCNLPAFTITASAPPSAPPSEAPPGSPSGSPSASPSESPSASPSSSPSPISCNNACSVSADCASGLTCSGGSCRNSECTSETDCTCAVAQGSPTPTPSPLPDAGISYPTIIGAGLGILVILGAILLII